MDGYSLCLEVRKSERFGGLPFVLYSGTHNSEEDRKLANAAGADGFIEKPAPIQTILAALGAAAGKHRSASARVARPEIEAPVLKQYSESLVRKLEEKSAELAQTEARLSGLVEAALDGIITVDERQNVVLFNSAAETMFGCLRAGPIVGCFHSSALSRCAPPATRGLWSIRFCRTSYRGAHRLGSAR
jgi:DNA-binding response OmpR family regulator